MRLSGYEAIGFGQKRSRLRLRGLDASFGTAGPRCAVQPAEVRPLEKDRASDPFLGLTSYSHGAASDRRPPGENGHDEGDDQDYEQELGEKDAASECKKNDEKDK